MEIVKLKSIAENIDKVIGRDSSSFKSITEPTWVRVAEYKSNVGAIGTVTFHFAWAYKNIGLDTGTFLGFYQESIYIPITKSERVKKYRIVYKKDSPYTNSYIDFLIEPFIQENLVTTSTLNDSFNNDCRSLCEYGATIPEGYTTTEYDIT